MCSLYSLLLFDVSCGHTGPAAAAARISRLDFAVQAIAQAESSPCFASSISESAVLHNGSFIALGATKRLSGRLEAIFQSTEAFTTAPRTGVANGAECVQGQAQPILQSPSRGATAGDDEALRLALEVVPRIPVQTRDEQGLPMAATSEQRLTVYRPVLSRGIKRHSFLNNNDDHIFGCFFRNVSFNGIDVFRLDPRGPGLHWHRRGTTPTITYPYDGPRGDGASCMINIERLAANRAYFNLVLEALEGERRVTEIKFDGNRLRCYGGWAVEDSATVAPTVRARTWLKLDAVLEDGPPPRLLLRVDGQLIYAIPLATRVRLRGVELNGWANAYGKTYYSRLAITDSVACAAARLVSLWLLRRANSDIALVVLAFAVPAPLLALLRANSTALRGKCQLHSDRGRALPTVDPQGRLHLPVLPPLEAFQQGAPPADAGVLEALDPEVEDWDAVMQLDRFRELTRALPTTHVFLLVAMMGELYSLTLAKDAYELVMRALQDTSQPSAVKVVKAMVSVAPMGDVLRAVAAAKAKVAPSA